MIPPAKNGQDRHELQTHYRLNRTGVCQTYVDEAFSCRLLPHTLVFSQIALSGGFAQPIPHRPT